MTDRRSKGKNVHVPLQKKKEFIRKVADFTGKGKFIKAARALGLGHIKSSQLSKWFKSRDQIIAATESHTRQKGANQYRCLGGGRKPILGGLEIVIYNQIMDLRAQKIRVTRLKVFKLALDIAAANEIDGFKASAKWINGFFKRHRLSLRRQSSLQTISDAQIVGRSVSFMRFLRHMLSDKYYFSADNIIAMDEMAVYFSSSQTTTVDITNRSSIVVKGTGFDSERMTCLVAIKPDGSLLKPFMILKGKEDGVVVERNGVLVTKTEKAWITEKSCKIWLKHAFPSTFFKTSGNRAEYTKMLVWDACPVHRADSIKKHLKSNVCLTNVENIKLHDFFKLYCIFAVIRYWC